MVGRRRSWMPRRGRLGRRLAGVATNPERDLPFRVGSGSGCRRGREGTKGDLQARLDSIDGVREEHNRCLREGGLDHRGDPHRGGLLLLPSHCQKKATRSRTPVRNGQHAARMIPQQGVPHASTGRGGGKQALQGEQGLPPHRFPLEERPEGDGVWCSGAKGCPARPAGAPSAKAVMHARSLRARGWFQRSRTWQTSLGPSALRDH